MAESAYTTPGDGKSGGFDFNTLLSKGTDILTGWASQAMRRQVEKDQGVTPTQTGQNAANVWIASNWPMLAAGGVALVIILWLVFKRH